MFAIIFKKSGIKSMPKILLGNEKLWQFSKVRLCTASSGPKVEVKYVNGLAKFTIPLPSRGEACGFTVKPVSNNVGDLLKMLQVEDKGIDRAAIFDNEGVRIASSCSIESLLDEPFCMHINSEVFHAEPPEKERADGKDLSTLGSVKTLVGQLYESLQVGEHYAKQEKELAAKLETLKEEIKPLEVKRKELDNRAAITSNMKTWVGLGLMSVQFGILARLTWWEYSWDIMEPVTFFVGYGTSIALYAYYCITRMEFNYNEVENRNFLLAFHNNAKTKGLNIEEYNKMKNQIAEVEFDLKRLKDPLYLQMPPHFQKSTVNKRPLRN